MTGVNIGDGPAATATAEKAAGKERGKDNQSCGDQGSYEEPAEAEGSAAATAAAPVTAAGENGKVAEEKIDA